jgi:hypothetical protein
MYKYGFMMRYERHRISVWQHRATLVNDNVLWIHHIMEAKQPRAKIRETNAWYGHGLDYEYGTPFKAYEVAPVAEHRGAFLDVNHMRTFDRLVNRDHLALVRLKYHWSRCAKASTRYNRDRNNTLLAYG